MSYRVLAILAVACATVACSIADSQGDELTTPRTFETEVDSGTSVTLPPKATSNPDPPAPPSVTVMDAGTDAPTTRKPAICTESDLALCLAFENDVVDHSSTPIMPVASNVGYVDGHDGKALLLDETSAVHLPRSAAFETTEVTVEAWIRRSTSADGVIFDADGRYALTINGGAVHCKTSGGDAKGGNLPVGQWVHVACVVAGGKVRAYAAGVERAKDDASIASNPNGTQEVGGNSPSGERFIGAIDSLRVFRVGRTADQIAAAAAP